jgi:hypothetical protein
MLDKNIRTSKIGPVECVPYQDKYPFVTIMVQDVSLISEENGYSLVCINGKFEAYFITNAYKLIDRTEYRFWYRVVGGNQNKIYVVMFDRLEYLRK